MKIRVRTTTADETVLLLRRCFELGPFPFGLPWLFRNFPFFQIIAIGVGDADVQQLKDMASPPYEHSVYHVSDYDSIKDIQLVLAAKLCESDGKKRMIEARTTAKSLEKRPLSEILYVLHFLALNR